MSRIRDARGPRPRASSRLIRAYRDAAAEAGWAWCELAEGLFVEAPTPPAALCWSELLELNRRVAALVAAHPGPDGLADFGAAIARADDLREFVGLPSLARSPALLWWEGVRRWLPALWPGLDSTVQADEDGRLRAVIALPGSDDDSGKLTHILRGALRALPERVGMPRAAVSCRLVGHEAILTMEPARRPGGRVGGALDTLLSGRSFADARAAIDLLASLEHELEGRERALHMALRQVGDAEGRALAAARARQDFVARMSHELRTPMTGMRASLQLLRAGERDPRRLELLDLCEGGMERLQRWVQRVLALGDRHGGGGPLHREPFEPCALLRRVVSRRARAAERKGLAITLSLPLAEPPAVAGDAEAISRCLEELLDNAISFSRAGPIRVRVRAEEGPKEGLDGITLHYEVLDSGPGIDEEGVEELFSAFTQADESSTRAHEGAGVGLTLSRATARRMGGEIGLCNSASGGACAWLRVPVARAGPDRLSAQ